MEDAVTARQRPKLERYGDTLLAVLRAAHYRDNIEEVDFSELPPVRRPELMVVVCVGLYLILTRRG